MSKPETTTFGCGSVYSRTVAPQSSEGHCYKLIAAERVAAVSENKDKFYESCNDIVRILTLPTPLTCSTFIRVWTTEKEINFFQDFGLSRLITQTIGHGNQLENLIEFRNGGGLGVTGSLSVDKDEINRRNGAYVRTNFAFESAKLDLGKWGAFNIPPIGKGWFDTIYLDDELRVDVNSRDDILICVPR